MKKFKNRILPKGLEIIKGYVYIRIFPNGEKYMECIGKLDKNGIIDEGISVLNKYREQIRLGKFGLEAKEKQLSVVYACEKFWELHGVNRSSSPQFWSGLSYIKTYFMNRYIDTITYIDVRDWYKWLHENQELSISSCNRYLSVFTTLFYSLQLWKKKGIIETCKLPFENPCKEAKTEIRKLFSINEKQFSRKRILSREEFTKFLEVSSPEIRAAAILAVTSMLRKGDLLRLSQENIDPANQSIKCVQSKTKYEVTIPLIKSIESFVQAKLNGKLLDNTNFRRKFEAARKASGVPYFQWRDLRKTGARWLLESGADISVVSSWLGHRSIEMTQIYVPSLEHHKVQAGKKLDEILLNCHENCHEKNQKENFLYEKRADL